MFVRRFLIVFIISWCLYIVATSGNTVVQTGWSYRLKLSPSEVQERAGDIFNQTAVQTKKQHIKFPPVIVLFVDDPQGLLRALPLTYWLYPTQIIAASSSYYDTANSLVTDVGAALKQITNKPNGEYILFVGKASNLASNETLFTHYRQTTIIPKDKDGLTAVFLEKS